MQWAPAIESVLTDYREYQDQHALSLTKWVVREEKPREGRFAVILLCLCCHKIERAGGL